MLPKKKKKKEERKDKIDKPLARLIKKNRERAQINKIRNEKEITTDATEIQSTIRAYYRQLHANKMDNLKEMDNFLERCNLPRLNQEEIRKMNRPITSPGIEFEIKKLPNIQKSRTDSFTGEIYQTFREELTPILLKLFPKIAEEGTLPNSF